MDPVPSRGARGKPRREMDEDEQEQRRRKVEAGRAKVNGGASSCSSSRCPSAGSQGQVPATAAVPCEERCGAPGTAAKALPFPPTRLEAAS